MKVDHQRQQETMISPETGEVLRRDVRPFVVSYNGANITVALPGFYPSDRGEGIHVGSDMGVVDTALRELKERTEGLPSPSTIRRIRKKLKLSQREAGAILRVGASAFDKYERGLVEPSGPTAQLIHVLDRHPELVDELRPRATSATRRD